MQGTLLTTLDRREAARFADRRFAAVMCGALAWVSAEAAATEPADAERCPRAAALKEEIESGLGALMAEHGFPGFSYSVVRAAGVIAEGGVGVRDRKSGKKVGPDTLFQIGSITKTFTGLTLARLAAEERLQLGDTLEANWFPESAVPADAEGRPITLQALATHTAGLPRYPSNLDRIDGDPILGYSIEEMRNGLAAVTLETAFPLPLSYSNFGYGVLAQAMANAEGVAFADLLADAVTAPLKLADTAFSISKAQAGRLATPYRDDDTMVPTQPWDMGTMSAAGGLFSTARDLGRFARWQLGGLPGALGASEDEARHLQRAPYYRYAATTNWGYGLGVFVVDDYAEGVDAIWHGGDIDGYAGSFVVMPDHDLAFTYLTNAGMGDGFEEFQKNLIVRAIELCGAG